MTRNPDKLNRVDYHWFIVRSLPHQEKKLAALFLQHQSEIPNLLEIYCPIHTTVSVSRGGQEIQAPLFAGFVFVFSTQQAVSDFIVRYYPEGTILYGSRKKNGCKPGFLTIPEEQMRLFKDFNENYADRVVILERPYSDYAFNPKTGEPNEIVRVIDGPLAGHEGYITRFHRDKRLVFHMKALESDRYFTISVPNIWDFHVIRLHNAEGDRQTIGTLKERAADLLIGFLQGCGYGARALPMLHDMIGRLAIKPSLVSLCKEFFRKGHETLSHRLAQMSTQEADLVLNLARYEHDNPGYVRTNWSKLVIRPFLTPTCGPDMAEDENEVLLEHENFTEIIRKIPVEEEVYYPAKEQSMTLTTLYYAHIGILPAIHGKEGQREFILFANWDVFLGKYFLTEGNAHEKLVSGTTQTFKAKDTGQISYEKTIESFRNYAPALYKILTDDDSLIKPVRDFKVGNTTLNVLAATATATDMPRAKDRLIHTCMAVCKEINTTTHLAVWRRYLRTVWLHN